MTLFRFFAAIFLFITFFAQISHSSGHGVAYIFATGPDLYDPTRTVEKNRWFKDPLSRYAKEIVESIIQRIHLDHPDAQVVHLASFSIKHLRDAYRSLDKAKEINLLVVAHGGISAGHLFLWADSEKIFENELLQTIGRTPTQTSFFTCHSGAASVFDFPGSVFGASLEHSAMDAAHFYGWAKFVTSSSQPFPLSAKEIYERWLDYRIHEEIERECAMKQERNMSTGSLNKLLLSESFRKTLQTTCWGRGKPFFYAERDLEKSPPKLVASPKKIPRAALRWVIDWLFCAFGSNLPAGSFTRGAGPRLAS